MSRDAGNTLDDRLVGYLSGGGAVIVAKVVDGAPVCALGRGVAARPESAELRVFGDLAVGDRVSVHTLGEAICAVAGTVTAAEPDGTDVRVAVSVLSVKDDRPPGLAVVPFAFLDETPTTGGAG